MKKWLLYIILFLFILTLLNENNTLEAFSSKYEGGTSKVKASSTDKTPGFLDAKVDNSTIQVNGSDQIEAIGLSKAAAITIDSTGAGVNITTHSDATDDFTVNTSALVVEGDTGKVGIGVTDPETLLELKAADAYLTLNNSTSEYTDASKETRINFKGISTTATEATLARIQAQHDGASDDQKGDLIFYTNDGTDADAPTERMRIDSAGNVGIGTNAPEQKLDIVGASGLDSATPITLRLHSTENNNWVSDAVPAQILFSTADASGGGSYPGTRAAIKLHTNIDGSDGNISFSTTAEGQGGLTEYMRITRVGGIAYTPTSDQVIAAGTGITSAMLSHIIRVAGNSGNIDITADPQIAAGTDGQIIIIQGTHDTDTVQFDTGTGLKLNAAGSFTVGLGDTLQLMYDSGESLWIEISRSNNT